MLAKITEDHVYVQTPYQDKALVTHQFNGVWSNKYKMFRFPKNLHCMAELMRRYPALKQNNEFMLQGSKLKAARNVFLQLKDQEKQVDSRLRPYQNTDVFYLSQLPAAGIFNEPRTGKTPTSIILMKELDTKRNLIISPASLIWNWEKEVKKWYEGAKVYVVSGTKSKRQLIYEEVIKDTHSVVVMIVSKDTWKSDHEKSQVSGINFDTCFVDEAHYLRNYKTAQSKAVLDINAERRYALTGTPTVKHGTDIYGILQFLYPKKFSSYWQFVERYWEVGKDWMGHAEIKDVKLHRKQELEELIGFISVQRKRKDIMKWLPDKERQTFHVKMEGKQLKAYKEMAEDFMTGELDAANVLTQLMRLRQICLDPRLVGIDAPSAKTKALLEYLENNREPIVIMSMFTSYFELVKPEIEKLGLKVGMIHGRMSNAEKQRAAEDFQAGKTDVLLANIVSAGTGFTLDVAEQILFLDKAWNPADNQQAEDRITPTTEEKNHKHTIISLVCDDSVDERINEILENKQSLTDVINNGGHEAIKRMLS